MWAVTKMSMTQQLKALISARSDAEIPKIAAIQISKNLLATNGRTTYKIYLRQKTNHFVSSVQKNTAKKKISVQKKKLNSSCKRQMVLSLNPSATQRECLHNKK